MKFKHLAAGLLSAVMVLGIAACSSDNGASEANGTNNTKDFFRLIMAFKGLPSWLSY